MSQLASVAPEEKPIEDEERGRRRSRRAAPAPVQIVKNPDVTAILISGFAYKDKLKGENPILDFRNRLWEIPNISTNTEIQLDNPDDPFLREFQIRLHLEEPIKQ